MLDTQVLNYVGHTRTGYNGTQGMVGVQLAAHSCLNIECNVRTMVL